MKQPCFHINTDWAVSESTAFRSVHQNETDLVTLGLFHISGKKRLAQGFDQSEMVVMDVTEIPIERPKCKQKAFYSGRKEQLTPKCQIVIKKETLDIICLHFCQGQTHDFRLFKALGVHSHLGAKV